jgi:rhodanese-related sulfurtransferase
VQFLLDHWFWAVTAVVSGTLLVLPGFGRARAGQVLDTLGATRLMNQGALVLDVRDPAEFAMGHVANSRNIPSLEVAQRLAELPERKPVIVLGHTGAAARVAGVLRKAGRSDVFCLEGGVQAWQQAGLPLFKVGRS